MLHENSGRLIKIAWWLLLLLLLVIIFTNGGPEIIGNKICGDVVEYSGEYTIVYKEHTKTLISNDYMIVLEDANGNRFPIYVVREDYINCDQGAKIQCSFNGYEKIAQFENLEIEVQ